LQVPGSKIVFSQSKEDKVNIQLTKVATVLMVIFLTPAAHGGELAFSSSPYDNGIEWGPCPEFFPTGCQIAVLNGDPAEPNADIYFKIPGGYVFPAHWHTSAERMVLVSGKLDVTYSGQETTHLTTGMYAYGPAKAVHEGKCISNDECILVIAFEQPVDAFEQE
jgi:quercetin dioxygenase-like cupin family protein